MSVQIKTPTKTTQFSGIQLRCDEKRDLQGDGVRKSKDDFHVNSKFSQPWNRKRRYSQSYRREEAGNPMRRKRIKSAYFEKPLPNRFLNGGSIDDPLNLNSLDSTELGKKLNSVTPKSSPLPTPKRRQSVQVRIPVNVTDPLNLNESVETEAKVLKATVQKLAKKKKHRHRHKKKDDCTVGPTLFSPPKNVAKDKNLMEALRIDIEPEVQNVPCKKDNVVPPKPRAVCDKIVSPVIRQTTPKHKKRRRTNSDGKPEPSAATSRSLLTSSSSSTSSPKKFKQPKQTSKGKGNKSMQGGQVKFIYGNYNRYYGYRNPATESDHRLKCFSKDWFEGKCVLDIGCNVGHLTLAIAKEFSPSKVTGIDIDHKLITAARKNVRYYISSSTTDVSKFPISNLLNYGPIEAPPIQRKGQTTFPHNVMFMQGNYVLEHDELIDIQREEYDVILALSITKWIHFNWGDAGLKRFFRRVYKQLRPGGVFILEPQPWSSYKKKKKLTDGIFKNFQEIRLRPEQFNDYLLSKEIGFSTCKTVDVPMNKSKGFRRPIMVFRKSETVQNSPLSECGNVTPPRAPQPVGTVTPPRRNESLLSMVSVATSEAISDRTSEYSSCSTCSCSSCCSEESPVKDDGGVTTVADVVKVTDETWETERVEEVTDCTRDKSAEETDMQVFAEPESYVKEKTVDETASDTQVSAEPESCAKDKRVEGTASEMQVSAEPEDSKKEKSAEEADMQVSEEPEDSKVQDDCKKDKNVEEIDKQLSAIPEDCPMESGVKEPEDSVKDVKETDSDAGMQGSTETKTDTGEVEKLTGESAEQNMFVDSEMNVETASENERSKTDKAEGVDKDEQESSTTDTSKDENIP